MKKLFKYSIPSILIGLFIAGFAYAATPNFWLLTANKIKPLTTAWDLLVGTHSSNPVEVDGTIYYNTVSKTFQCGINGSFTNCANATSTGLSGTGINGQVTYFNGASSVTGDASYLWDATNHKLSINSTTPQATFVVQGSSTAATLDIFRVSSSSNSTFLSVTSGGNVNVATLTASSLVGTDANKNLNSIALPLSVANGGTGTSSISSLALANLSLGGSNLSFTSGDGIQVLLGTSTQISLSNSPSFSGTLSVTGTSTLATTTITKLTVTGAVALTGVSDCNSTQFLQITTGVFGCGTPSGGGGGTGVGWASSTNALGAFIYTNFGGMVGINSTSPTANLVVQGPSGSTTPEFVVSSSTGVSQFQVNANGTAGFRNVSYTWPSSQGTQGQYLGNTGTGIMSWLNPLFLTVCSSGCNYTATSGDAQVGINAAIAAANAAGGGTVLIKAGTYNTTVGQDINMSTTSNVSLIGEGMGTLIALSNSSGMSIYNSNNIKLSDLRVTSVNGNTTLNIGNSNNVWVDHTNMSVGTPAFVVYAYSNDAGADSKIFLTNNYFQGAGKQDIIGGGPQTSTASSTINLSMVITGNILVQQTFNGGVIDSGMDVNCMDQTGIGAITFTDNVCYGDIVLGNERYPDRDSVIANNVVRPPVGPVYASGQIWLGQDGNASGSANSPRNLIITGNTITDGNIYMYAGASNLWASLQITNNNITVATTTAARTTQSQNGQGYNCIRLEYADNAMVSGNICNGANDGSSDGVAIIHSTNTNVASNRITNFWNAYQFYNTQTGDQATGNIVNNASTSTTSILPITQLNSSGQFGINTTTQNATLHVQGLAGTANLFQLSSSSGSSLLSFSPAGVLTINGLSTGCLQSSSGVISSTGVSCGGGSGNSAWTIGSSLIYNATSTDSVLIGTSTPVTSTLFVQGSGTKLALTIASSSGQTLMTVDGTAASTGVSIGTTSTSSTLIVQGSGTTNPFNIASSSSTSMLSVSVGATTTVTNLVVSGLSGTQCLREVSGIVQGTGSDCGAGGSGFTSAATTTNGNVFSVATTSNNISINIPQNIINNVSTGTVGNVFNISTSTLGTGSALVINLPTASGSNSGQLSSTDWTTFNSKVATSRTINTTAPITGGGDLSADRTIACNVASISQAGCLASADFLTFNNKLSGAATAGQVAYYSAATTTAGTTNFLWDNTAKSLIINSSTPSGGTLTLIASTSAQTIPILQIASTTGTPFFTVNANNNIVAQNEALPTFSAGTQKFFTVVGSQAGGVARIVRDVGTGITGSTFYGTYDITAYSATSTIDFPDFTGACQTFSIATGTMQNIIGDVCSRRDSGNSTGDMLMRTYTNGVANQTLLLQGNTNGASAIITGVPGAGAIFQVASSSGVSVLRVSGNGAVGIGTTTNTSLLYVQGTSTQPTITTFIVASSSGAVAFTVSTAAALPTDYLLTVASSTNNTVALFQVDGLGNTFLNHLVGSSTLPTVATSTGDGTGGTDSIDSGSTDLAGLVTVTTGTSPTANATIWTLTFARAFLKAPYCSITSATTTPLFIEDVYATTTTTTLVLKSTTTAIPASGVMGAYYQCIGQQGG